MLRGGGSCAAHEATPSANPVMLSVSPSDELLYVVNEHAYPSMNLVTTCKPVPIAIGGNAYQKPRPRLVKHMRDAAHERRDDARPGRILLTGGVPFVGSHIAERFADDLPRDIRVSARVGAALAGRERVRVAVMGGLQCDQSMQHGDYR